MCPHIETVSQISHWALQVLKLFQYINDCCLTAVFESFGPIGGARAELDDRVGLAAPMAAAPPPAPAPGVSNGASVPSQPAAPPKLRSLFPETWLWADTTCECVVFY